MQSRVQPVGWSGWWWSGLTGRGHGQGMCVCGGGGWGQIGMGKAPWVGSWAQGLCGAQELGWGWGREGGAEKEA